MTFSDTQFKELISALRGQLASIEEPKPADPDRLDRSLALRILQDLDGNSYNTYCAQEETEFVKTLKQLCRSKI